MRALNARWRGLDKPTNVLSFPAAAPERLGETPVLGDVVVAFETMAREADDEGKALADHFRHLVVHGFLHLLGFDHRSDAEAEAMEALERRILARLGVADPYGEAAGARRMSDAERRRARQARPRRSPQLAACSSGCAPCSGWGPASVRDDIEDALEDAAEQRRLHAAGTRDSQERARPARQCASPT